MIITLISAICILVGCIKPPLPSTTQSVSTHQATKEGWSDSKTRATKAIPKAGLYNEADIAKLSKSLTGTGGGVEPVKDTINYPGGEITLPISFRFSAYNDLSNIIITLDGVPQMFTVIQDDPAEGQGTPALNHYVKHPQNIEKATIFTFHVRFVPSVGKTGDILPCGMIAMNLPDVWFDPECTIFPARAKRIFRSSSTYLKFEADGTPDQPAPPPHPSGITAINPSTKTESSKLIYFDENTYPMTYSISTDASSGIIVEKHITPIKFNILIHALENSSTTTICIIDKTPILIGNNSIIHHGKNKRGESISASFELDISKATQLHTVMILGNWVGPDSKKRSGFHATEGDNPYVYAYTVFREAEFPNHLFKTP